ncbi:hypothetical protein [Runella limosa]|jgi:hypothetical protein|uniref:hypothetical protein n=1 Tax=Runella limosa TaxID=370978 RepID=UPI0003FA1768|nr:hypothetical protein [Runella limosa]
MITDEKFVIKSYGKSELAALYGWHMKTLKRKMLYYGLDWPPDNVFTPKQVAHIVEKLGIPFSLFED